MMNSEQGTTGSALGGGRRVPVAPVPAGYKRTEVGVIPEDWERSSVSAIASSTRNAIVGGPFGSDLVSKDYVAHGVPVIRGQNMSGRWVSGSFVFVTPTKAKSLEANLAHPGDIIFTQRGTLGQVSLVPAKPFSAYLVSQSQMKLSVNRKVADPLFLFYFFTSYEQQKSIQGRTIQTGVPHINLGILREMPVRLPPLAEQCAIAEALSDVDGLLAALEALIAKKQAVKQAAMQQLLTGKSRLPGFSGAWETKRLGELEQRGDIRLFRGKVISQKDIDRLPGDYPIYSSSIHFDGLFGSYGDYMFDEELITWSVDGGGHFFYRPKHRFSVTNVCGYLRIGTSSIDYRYLAYHLQSLHSRKVFDYTVKAHPSVIRSSYNVALPQPNEQRAIATVLSDIDAEIAVLERRRDKTRVVKQGMMQQLLTGRVRLVRPDLDRIES